MSDPERIWSADHRRSAVAHLLEAYRTREPILPFTDAFPDLTPTQAYEVQLATVSWWLRHGHRVVGKKIGLTSKTTQAHFGVYEPDYGHLTDEMSRPEDSVIELSELIQPRIEGEIGFVLGRDLRGRVTPHEVLSAIDYAVAVLEVCDTRVANWRLRAADMVADNTCSAMYVIGGLRRRIDNLDLRRLGMVLERNGEVCDTGAAIAVMGNPVNAVIHLARKLADVGAELKAGELILSGAISTMIPVRPGDRFHLRIEELGSVRIGFSGDAR